MKWRSVIIHGISQAAETLVNTQRHSEQKNEEVRQMTSSAPKLLMLEVSFHLRCLRSSLRRENTPNGKQLTLKNKSSKA